jgi:DNA-directed RNA polymerase subunit RPC12/RpoP
MGPRANYECARCTEVEYGKDSDQIVVYDDLPIKSVRCPVCGYRRGFRRRFDAIQVSTTGHRIAKILDPMMQPQFDQMSATKDAAKRSEQQLAEDHARAIEILPEPQRPAMREALEGGPSKWMPARAALGGISPQAASDSRHHIFPHIRRRVIPTRA